MRITFDKQTVAKLLQASEAATDRRPTMEQLFDAALRKDGKTPDTDLDNWPTEDDLKPNIIPAGLWLVGDQGAYLMSNQPLTNNEKPAVTYANEINPKTLEFDEWYEAKRTAFGGDDGVIFLSAKDVRDWISTTPGAKLAMKLTPNHIEFLGSK